MAARQPGSAGGKEHVEEVLSGLERLGVEVWRGATEYLEHAGAAASYAVRPGQPGIIMVGEQTEYGDVLHEARHYYQDRRAGFPGPEGYSRSDVVQGEIDAYLYELRAAKHLDYSQEHVSMVYAAYQRYVDAMNDLES